MKTIVICDKEHKIDCNALTYVKYKSIFKTGILYDIQKIQTFVTLQKINKEKIERENPDITQEELEETMGNLMMPVIDEFIRAITQIAWIMIYSVDNTIEDYEEWLKGIKKFSVNDKWIVEVTEFAVDCFC